jgi:hypothetical protein
MESAEKFDFKIDEARYDALYEAWELVSFAEGAITPKLEVVDVGTTPFLNGLYRTIQEIKKRLDFVTNPEDDK